MRQGRAVNRFLVAAQTESPQIKYTVTGIPSDSGDKCYVPRIPVLAVCSRAEILAGVKFVKSISLPFFVK